MYFAVMSLTSLCLMEGNPPWGNSKNALQRKFFHKIHFDGRSPAISKTQGVSKVTLVKTESITQQLVVVNQLEGLFSFAISTARFSDAGRTDDRLVNFSFCASRVCFLTSYSRSQKKVAIPLKNTTVDTRYI